MDHPNPGRQSSLRKLRARLAGSPAVTRFLPLALVLVLTSLQGQLGESSRYWFYLVKCLVGALALGVVWPLIPELRWRFSPLALAAGVGIYLVWVLADPYYPKLTSAGPPWNPHHAFGENLALFFIAVRILGSTFIMPPLEEIFYRSFLYRYFAQKDFLGIPLNRFMPGPFVITTLLFGFAHREWLAGIICGATYQALVLKRNGLGDALTAHAITNLLLGLHVALRAAYHFW